MTSAGTVQVTVNTDKQTSLNAVNINSHGQQSPPPLEDIANRPLASASLLTLYVLNAVSLAKPHAIEQLTLN